MLHDFRKFAASAYMLGELSKSTLKSRPGCLARYACWRVGSQLLSIFWLERDIIGIAGLRFWIEIVPHYVNRIADLVELLDITTAVRVTVFAPGPEGRFCHTERGDVRH